MYYRRCESCGSKALATATRCPRCELAFELNDAHGKRHRLVPCRNCKVVQPATVDSCRWCGASRSSRAFPHRTVGLVTGTMAAAALLFATRGSIVPIVQSSFTTMTAGATDAFSSATTDAPGVVAAPPSAPPIAAPTKPTAAPAVDTVPVIAVQLADNAPMVAPSATATDSMIAWEEAKAVTWVNVRADRSRDATIVAVVSPDDIVRLGARASGWRQVNVDGATGWVDGRHFTPSRQN